MVTPPLTDAELDGLEADVSRMFSGTDLRENVARLFAEVRAWRVKHRDYDLRYVDMPPSVWIRSGEP